MLALPLTAAVLLHATPDADGPADGDGDRALRAVLAARRACGSTACASCRSTWSARSALALRRGQRAARLVAGLAVDALAVRRRLRHRHGLHHRRHRGADRADAGGARANGWSRRMRRTRSPARAPRWPGPGFAGVLIKLVGAPLALLVDAVLLLRLGADPARHPCRREARVPRRRRALLARPARRPALRARPSPAGDAGRARSACWQMCHHAAIVVQILFATRTLGLTEQAVGLSYIGMGVGTVAGQRARATASAGASGPGRAWCWASRSAAPAGCCWRVAPANALGRRGVRADAAAVLGSARCSSSSTSSRCARR